MDDWTESKRARNLALSELRALQKGILSATDAVVNALVASRNDVVMVGTFGQVLTQLRDSYLAVDRAAILLVGPD